MKTHHHHHQDHQHHHNHPPPPKLKTPLFSCSFFGHCTRTVLSPTSPSSTPLPPPPPVPQSTTTPQPNNSSSESSSSSSTTSQSFTQWKFPTTHTHTQDKHKHIPLPLPPPITPTELQELFHVAELQLCAGSHTECINALQMLERSLVPNPHSVCEHALCPPAVMEKVVSNLKEAPLAKHATKVLLALCLAEGNRHVAVEAGAVGRVVEALPDLEGSAAERSLAALELLCTVAEGAASVRAHALAVPMLVESMGKISSRGREYAIGVLGVIYASGSENELMPVAPPEEVARAVVLALQGDCTTRGKKKGAQLLKILEENGRVDVNYDQDGE